MNQQPPIELAVSSPVPIVENKGKIIGLFVFIPCNGGPLSAEIVDVELRTFDGGLQLVYVTKGVFCAYIPYYQTGFYQMEGSDKRIFFCLPEFVCSMEEYLAFRKMKKKQQMRFLSEKCVFRRRFVPQLSAPVIGLAS